MNYFCYDFDLVKLYIAEENGEIISVSSKDIINNEKIFSETKIIRTAKEQLSEYFSGNREKFDLPLKLNGTAFQNKVWRELLKIPYGETVSYRYIAEKVENANYSRAIGMANNSNPIMIIIPCHRVIGKGGELTGYAGGISLKKALLELENNKNRLITN